MRRRAVVALFVAAASVATACNALLGVDELHDRAGDADGAAGGDDAAAGDDGGGGGGGDGSSADGGGSSGDGGATVTYCDAFRNDPSVLFCADFDRATNAAGLATGWTSALVADAGSLSVTPTGDAGSAPNAARFQFSRTGGRFVLALLRKDLNIATPGGLELSFDVKVAHNPYIGQPATGPTILTVAGLVGGNPNAPSQAGIIFGGPLQPSQPDDPFLGSIGGASGNLGYQEIKEWKPGVWTRVYLTLEADPQTGGVMRLRFGAPDASVSESVATASPDTWRGAVSVLVGAQTNTDGGPLPTADVDFAFDDVVLRAR